MHHRRGRRFYALDPDRGDPVCFDVEGDNGGPALDVLKAKLPGFEGCDGEMPEE
jgi:hypothetical protein